MPITMSQYWLQLDDLSKTVVFCLILMSLTSWFIIFSRAWRFWRVRKSAPAQALFWDAPSFEEAVNLLSLSDVENIYLPLAQKSIAAVNAHGNSNRRMGKTQLPEILTRVLRQELNRVIVKLESGLTVLASIGATAPFVGLLGTVWGIYHALTAVSGANAIQIEVVAGPVGEALVMTGLGLMVAIPAVLAYNALNRINRITFSELDGFAFDLHAHWSANALATNSAIVKPTE